MSDRAPQAPPGWYRDRVSNVFHYWDGVTWTGESRVGSSQDHPRGTARGARLEARNSVRRTSTADALLGCTLAFGLSAFALFVIPDGGPLRAAGAVSGALAIVSSVVSGVLRGPMPRASSDASGARQRPELVRPVLFSVITALCAALVARGFHEEEVRRHFLFVLIVMVAAAAPAVVITLASHYRWRRRTIAPIAAMLALLEWRWPFGRWKDPAVGHVSGVMAATSAVMGVAATVAVLQAVTLITGNPASLDGVWRIASVRVTHISNFTEQPNVGQEHWRLQAAGQCGTSCTYIVNDGQSVPFVLRPFGHSSLRGTRSSWGDCATKPQATPYAYANREVLTVSPAYGVWTPPDRAKLRVVIYGTRLPPGARRNCAERTEQVIVGTLERPG
jgi:hypothetical protein